ncbi:hypothetical protein, partial [Staphylococcus aureus]
FFKQKTAYEIARCLVGSEMCIRDSLARASDYFSEAGAPAATKAIGEQTFRYINGERPTESPGASKVYTFIGAGDASYTISFKTQGPTTNKLYYAAGGRALEYLSLIHISEPTR